jgi:leucine dehydrogenase
MAEFTPYVIGHKNLTISTSCFTSYGVLNSIRVAVEFLYNTTTLKNLKVAVQGVGKTGYYLCKYLHELGVKLYVTDCNTELVNRVVTEFNATAVDIDSIYNIEVDVFSPCALGSIINEQTINQLKCQIICGAANNQLADSSLAQTLLSRNILYVPDYIANAGGLVSVYYGERMTNNDILTIFTHIDKIALTLKEIFTNAQNTSATTNLIADEIAKTKLSRATIN